MTTEPMIDSVIASVLKVFPASSSAEDVQTICETVQKIVPYAETKHISQRVAKLQSEQDESIVRLNSSENVKDYIQSLLQENSTGLSKPEFSERDESYKANKNNSDFNMKSLSSALNGLQKTEQYNEESCSPNMVIHVCDEAKNLKQDFDCPRDLLIQEMRYFAEYLSVDAQRLEEVDISVHCDIHIFDWLMRYVKRGTKLISDTDIPKLDPNNVISILISSDFLKMESLVTGCIEYCHKHMSQIVATPCNMNCVNDKLTTLIAEKFNHTELEDVKDRKDKFKSKLFCKKIEKLFDPTALNIDSPGRGSSLFKCAVCQRLLTWDLNSKLPCTNNRLSVNGRGGLSYDHEPDPAWDINSYLISQFEELHKWNLVYWRLWGVINYLTCSRCGVTFQLCDFGNCMHHPERPHFRLLNVSDTSESPVGVYPCCNQQVLRFDPTGLNNGCRAKDHVATGSILNGEQQRLVDDFMTHKALIKSPLPMFSRTSDLNIFASEESRCSIKETTMTPIEIFSSVSPIPSTITTESQKKTVVKKKGLVTDVSDEDVAGEDDMSPLRKSSTQLSLNLTSSQNLPLASYSTASLGNDTNRSVLSSKKKEKIPIPTDTTSYKKYPIKQRWDAARSIRFNQDIQREEDRRRMASITTNLAKQRSTEKTDKVKIKDPKELSGGIFMKLEMAFFNNLKTQGGNQVQNFSRQFGGKDFKSKSRR